MDDSTIYARTGLPNVTRPSTFAPWFLSILLGIGWMSIGLPNGSDTPSDVRKASDRPMVSDVYSPFRGPVLQYVAEAVPEAESLFPNGSDPGGEAALQAFFVARNAAHKPSFTSPRGNSRSVYDGRSPPARAPPLLFG